jgi:hypothetical protein
MVFDAFFETLDQAIEFFGGDIAAGELALDSLINLPDSWSFKVFGTEGIGVKAPKADVEALPEYTSSGGLVLHMTFTLAKPATGKAVVLFNVGEEVEEP